MAKTEAIRDQPVPLDPTVRALGVVSLLNDFSSEVAVRTLPLFLANVAASLLRHIMGLSACRAFSGSGR
jgi:hypothetical protein